MTTSDDGVKRLKEILVTETAKNIVIEAQDFSKVKPGDTVLRWLAGIVSMEQVVTDVDDVFIYTGGPDGWRFWRESGFEYDPDLNLPPGVICSYLTTVKPS